jgi:DNA-directed RNA polymerase sigma subunit (sigma70/sigma32)
VLDVADRDGTGLHEVAAIMGVTPARIIQIEDRAIKKIGRNPRSYRNLKQFADP